MIRKAVLGRAAVWGTAGVIGVAALTAAGVSLASEPGSTTTTAASTTSTTTTTGDHKRVRSLEKRALHGQFTIRTPKKNGGFTVVDAQRGEFTAVGPTSVTLKSADGFTQTYVVSSTTKVKAKGKDSAIADVKVGDKGNVVGAFESGQHTALRVGDSS